MSYRAPQMKSVNIRMSQPTWDAIVHEADRDGVSASEFIREAIYFRLGHRYASKMDDDELVQRLIRIGLIGPQF